MPTVPPCNWDNEFHLYSGGGGTTTREGNRKNNK